jgi:YD repeat-containing protein
MSYEKTRYDHVLSSHRSGDGSRFAMVAAADALAANVPLLYDASGNVISTATRSGNTTQFVTHDAGSKTAGNVPEYDADGNLTDSGSAAGGGGGGSGFWTITAPPSTGWSWVNQGSATVDDSSGSIVLLGPAEGSFNLHLRVRSFPASEFTLRALLTAHLTASSSSLAGICVRESGTGKIVTFGYADDASFLVTQWNSPTSFNANYGLASMQYKQEQGVWFELDWQATNRVFSVSFDNFRTDDDKRSLHTVARNDFATTAFDEIGIYVTNTTSTALPLGVHSWEE